MYRLIIEPKKDFGRLKAEFPWSFKVDLLTSSLFEGGDKNVLLGTDSLGEAKELKESHTTKDGINNLKETASSTGHDSKEKETLETDIGLVSIVDDMLCLQNDKHAEPFGAVHPEYDRKWETYKLSTDKNYTLSCVSMNHSLFQKTLLHQLNTEFDKNVKLKSYFPDDNSRWDNFVLRPSIGGPDLVFGVAATSAVVHGTIIKILGGKYHSTSTASKTAEDNVIATSPLTHITIKREGNRIVCSFPQGKTIDVMPANAFRGWQFVPITSMNLGSWTSLGSGGVIDFQRRSSGDPDRHLPSK